MKGEDKMEARDATDKFRRIAFMHKLLLDRFELEKEFELEVYKIQMKYAQKYEDFYSKNNEVIHGTTSVNDADLQEVTSLLHKCPDFETKYDLLPHQDESHRGLKDFWLTAMKHSPDLWDMIQDHDKDILGYLSDIRVVQIPEGNNPKYPKFDGYGFVLEFHFLKNPYFSNEVLYKWYCLDFKKDEASPFEFDGLQPVKVEVSTIDWYPDKNVTVKVVKKTQKNKKTKQTRVVSVNQKVESFFNFFTRIDESCIPDLDATERELVLESLVQSDYDLACFIQSEFLPRSILFYMDMVPNQYGMDDEDADDDDTDDYSDEDDDDDDDNDSDEHGPNMAHRKPVGNHGRPPRQGGGGDPFSGHGQRRGGMEQQHRHNRPNQQHQDGPRKNRP